MILHTTWEDLNNAQWDIKITYNYYPKIKEAVILEVHRKQPVKHLDDLQWVEFDQYDGYDYVNWEKACVAQELQEVA